MCFNDSFIVLFHCVLLYNVESSLVWPLFEPFSRRVETINQSVKQELGEKFEFSFGTKMETKIKQHDCIFWLNYTWLVAFLLLNALNDFANGRQNKIQKLRATKYPEPREKKSNKALYEFFDTFFRHRCYFIIIHPFCLLSMIYPFCENLNTTTTFPCISSLDPLIAFFKLKSPVFLFLQNRLSSLTLAQKIYVCRNQLSNM